MANYAIIDDNDKVINVIRAEQDFIDAGSAGDPARCIQTSYNTRGGVHYGADGLPDGGVALRLNYAGIGFTYNRELDAFVAPQPDANFTLDTNTGLWINPDPNAVFGIRI
jgi:hypothetical protein